MKKFIVKFTTVVLYVLMVAYLSGFQIGLLLDWKALAAVLSGSILFSIPAILGTDRRSSWRDTVCKNIITAGYIATFLFLFARLNQQKGYENLLSDIALNCRPLLYSLILYILLKQEKQEKEVPEAGIQEKDGEKDCTKESDTAEQIYYVFRSKGLTQREAEVARLAGSGRSNKEIAEELVISETTVKKHMQHIFEKLEIESREELRKM